MERVISDPGFWAQWSSELCERVETREERSHSLVNQSSNKNMIPLIPGIISLYSVVSGNRELSVCSTKESILRDKGASSVPSVANAHILKSLKTLS